MITEPSIKVLLDSDVVSHFIKGEQTELLNIVFPDRLAIADEVIAELNKHPKFKLMLPALIKQCNIEVVDFPTENVGLTLEYANLVRQFGPGESACMVLARHRGNYIASSNRRDIKKYCAKYNIKSYSTLDIMHEAIQKDYISEQQCDAFIELATKRNSKLGCNTYQEYLNRQNN